MSQDESQREYWNMLYNPSEFDCTKLDMTEVDFTMIDPTTQPPLDEPNNFTFGRENDELRSGSYDSDFSTCTYDKPGSFENTPPRSQSAKSSAFPSANAVSGILTIVVIFLLYFLQNTMIRNFKFFQDGPDYGPFHVNNLFIYALLYGLIRGIIAFLGSVFR